MQKVPGEQVRSIFPGLNGATFQKALVFLFPRDQEILPHPEITLMRVGTKLSSAEGLIQLLSDGFLQTNLIHQQNFKTGRATMLR